MTFYQFIVKFYDPSALDPMSRLANRVHDDLVFPKQAESFEEISSYLELNPDYGNLLTIFDDAWHKYQSEV